MSAAVTELLELPAVSDLSEPQVRGANCVWCGIVLASDMVVDLGPRPAQRAGEPVTWFPRSCRPCMGKRAYRALLDHAPLCERCVDDASGCGTGVGLRRLMREARR